MPPYDVVMILRNIAKVRERFFCVLMCYFQASGVRIPNSLSRHAHLRTMLELTIRLKLWDSKHVLLLVRVTRLLK